MEFLIYKKFHEQENAAVLAQILKDNQIEFEITEDRHRKHGTRIFIIGTIMFLISLVTKIATTEF